MAMTDDGTVAIATTTIASDASCSHLGKKG